MLDAARHVIRNFTGLHPDEDLGRVVLHLCDEVGNSTASDPRLKAARSNVESRCRYLAQVSDRFSERDPAVIAEARIRAIVAVDLFQDVVLDVCRSAGSCHPAGVVLRKRGV